MSVIAGPTRRTPSGLCSGADRKKKDQQISETCTRDNHGLRGRAGTGNDSRVDRQDRLGCGGIVDEADDDADDDDG